MICVINIILIIYIIVGIYPIWNNGGINSGCGNIILVGVTEIGKVSVVV